VAKNFKDLSEQEILALAISSEETDARIYADFAAGLKTDYPTTAQIFAQSPLRPLYGNGVSIYLFHTPFVHKIFEPFSAIGCPKPIDFPRKMAREGAKPFGHGKSSDPENDSNIL